MVLTPDPGVDIFNSHADANDPDTLLASGISNSDLTITLTDQPADLANYTSGRQFGLLLRDPGGGSNEEWVLCDDYNGSLVVTVNASGRGYSGSTAVAHLANDEVLFATLRELLERNINGKDINPRNVLIDGESGATSGGDVTPSQLTADTHNLDLDGAFIVHLDTDAAGYFLTGIVAPDPAYARQHVLIYDGADDLTLPREDTGSTDINRFDFPDLTLDPDNRAIAIVYGVDAERWVLVGGAGSGSASPATQIIETSGPTTLDIDAIADGEFLKRVGSQIVGATPSGGGGGSGALTIEGPGQLSGNVTLTSADTWYDGPTVSLDDGDWVVVGKAIIDIGSSGFTGMVRLYDGTTGYGLLEAPLGEQYRTLTTFAKITVTGGPLTIKLQARTNTTGATLLQNGVNQTSTRSTEILAFTAAAAPTSGMLLLDEQVASASASLIFANIFTSDYDQYIVELIDLVISSDGHILGHFSQDGGSTWDTSAIYQQLGLFVFTGTGPGNLSQDDQTRLLLIENLDSDANRGGAATFKIYNPLGSKHKKIMGEEIHYDSGAANWVQTNKSFAYEDTAAVDSLRITPSTGNIASGTVRIYGLTKP